VGGSGSNGSTQPTVRRPWRRTGAGAAAALLAGTLAVVGPAQPAGAEFASGTATSWAYTDIRTPLEVQLDPAGDVPAGAWRDESGGRHIARAYATFGIPLAELAGRHIYTATVVFLETAGTGCDDRQLEARVTDPVTAQTSWVSPPAPRSGVLEPEVFDIPIPCPGIVAWQATGPIREAVSAGEETLTVELQVPRRHMADLAHGRRFFPQANLSVEYETRPLPRPEVSSPDYPEQTAVAVLGARIPGEFTFDAGGHTGTVGFQWSWSSFGGGDPFQSDEFVFADEPGGTATVQLAPPDWGSQTLSVRSIRADGVIGGTRRYQILVQDTAPSASWDPAQVAAGVPLPVTFTPVVDDVLRYEFVVEVVGGAEVATGTVPAGPDGTATTTITLPAPELYFLRAQSVHPDWTSTESRFLLFVP